LVSENGFNPKAAMAACITPFFEDESLDLGRLGSHIEFMLDSGIQGILATGGSGEYANLTPEERRLVVTESIKAVDGRVPVVVGALGPSTREALEVGMHAAEQGASALLVLPPYYIKPSFDGVIGHFETIAKETALTIVVYNIPSRTGWPLEREHLLRLSEIPGVVAVKECERDMASIALKIAALKDKMEVMSGDDDLSFPTFLAGGAGAIWAGANLTPKLYVELFNACNDGDVAKARELNNRLVHIFETWMGPNHPGPLKEAMALVGRPVGLGRKPLAPMTKERRAAMKKAFDAFGPVE
jgi:4-hydroxy-tetrahydrodipicolinate synthase